MVAGDTRGTVEFGAQWEGDKGGTSTQRGARAWPAGSGHLRWRFEEWDPGALDHEGGKGQPM
jgi:hypothetical protein